MSGALTVAEAAQRIQRGGLVAYPTETIWGLAADARSEAAVARLFSWKGREPGQAISVLVGDAAAPAQLGADWTPLAERLAAKLWPGPLTIVVRCASVFAPGIAAAGGSVGFRCSPHPVARALARACGVITATSLNRSGEAACATRAEAERCCAGSEIALVAGEDAHGAAPSTVVDASGARPRVLREGAVTARALDDVVAGGIRG